jgi:hypothetical protein
MKVILVLSAVFLSSVSFGANNFDTLLCAIETNGVLTPIVKAADLGSATVFKGVNSEISLKLTLMNDDSYYADAVLGNTAITVYGATPTLFEHFGTKTILSIKSGDVLHQVWCRVRQ